MMVGMQDFDVDDWEKHTIYKNYTKNAKQVQWFWQVSSPRGHLRTYVRTYVCSTVRVRCPGVECVTVLVWLARLCQLNAAGTV